MHDLHDFDFSAWAAAQGALVEQALTAWVGQGAPAGLGEAMRYAVLDGGKRLRPLLVLAACEAVGGPLTQALRQLGCDQCQGYLFSRPLPPAEFARNYQLPD